MNHENGSYGGHSGGFDLTGALTRANVEGRRARMTRSTSSAEDSRVDGVLLDDNALHPAEDTVCSACGAPLSSRDSVRVTPHGTRHDSCP